MNKPTILSAIPVLQRWQAAQTPAHTDAKTAARTATPTPSGGRQGAHTRPRLVLAAALCATLFHGAALAQAASLLPPDEQVIKVLSQQPSWQAQRQQSDADGARAEQTRVGSAEWTPSFSYGRRSYHGASAGEPATREWAVDLSRGLRLPGKAQADQALADTQRQSSQAQTLSLWRTLSLGLLQHHAEWLKAVRTEAIWQAQVDLSQSQLRLAERRHQLGDAARIDATQVAANQAQAMAQLAAATQKRLALGRQLQSLYPGWPLPTQGATPPDLADSWPQAQQALATLPSRLDEAALQALLNQHPDKLAADQARTQAQALARRADAERLADPTVGVQVAQDRSGAERLLSLNVSWPLGSAYRDLGHTAQWRQAQAVALQSEDAQRRLQNELAQAWQETLDSAARWQLAREAQNQFDAVASALDKGYRLGEGQLSDVLQARRLAKDQALLGAQAEIDTWQALWRWQIESGQRWVAPDAAPLP